jgi:signal transduction histidine kinase
MMKDVTVTGCPLTRSETSIDGPDAGGEGIHGGEGAVAAEAHVAALLALRAKFVAAQESERSRLARELHDDLGQQVALLLLKLDMATRDRQISPTRLLVTLSETGDGLRRLASAIQDLSHDLYPGRLRLLGLEQTLRALCSEVSDASHAQVRFHSDGLPSEVSEDAALSMVRVAQESLRNALKHSEARIIDVLLRATASQLTLRVTDDGGGFDSVASQLTGIGLLTMRERVELLGGRLIVTTAPGCGTTIEAIVPLRDWSDTAGHALCLRVS